MQDEEHSPQQQLYTAGSLACSNGLQKTPPAGLSMEDKHWWLAGYSDREIDMAAEGEAEAALMVRTKRAVEKRRAAETADIRRRWNDIRERQEIEKQNREVWEE